MATPLPTLTKRERAVELARPWILLTSYLIAGALEWWVIAISLAVATYFAAFAQMHDAMHGSLRLPRQRNARLLSLSALLLIASGHALRASHLLHHDRRRKNENSEETYTTWGFWRVLIVGPFHLIALRFSFLRREPNTRALQLWESAAGIALLAVSLIVWQTTGTLVGLVYPTVAIALSAAMPLWAAWLPHRLSDHHPLKRLAVFFALPGTPVLSAFAFHHLHHELPSLPTRLLPIVAKERAAQAACGAGAKTASVLALSPTATAAFNHL